MISKNSQIFIGQRKIGDNSSTFIIAEAASTHDRNLQQAFKLIDIAYEAGADAVKFQIFSADTLSSNIQHSLFNDLKKKSKEKIKNLFQLYKQLQAPRDWTPQLAQYTIRKGLIFLSTPFDYQAVEELEAAKIIAYKISNFDITDLPFLSYIAKKGKPIILSAGMCTLGEIEEAVATIEKEDNHQIIILHCILGKQYPSQPEEANLRSINTLNQAFPYPVGLSDHTLSIALPSVAVALGACVIEKHFTLSRSLQSFDHKFSLEPQELKMMIKNIRDTEKALGSQFIKPLKDELIRRKRGRRSIFAIKNIKKGDIVTRESIATLRPALGLAPKYLNIIIGRKARKNIKKNEAVDWNCV